VHRESLLRPTLQAGAVGLLLLALAIASQSVGATYGAGGPPPPATRAEEVPTPERSRLTNVGGIPVVRLSGSHYEMGRQHGAILKRQILFLLEEYFEGFAVPIVRQENLDKWTAEVEPFIPKHLKEEMRGLAEGAGLEYRRVLQVNTMVDRLQSMMCSTVVALGDATVDGEVYFGRNLDFPGRNVLHRTTVVLVYEPEGKTPLVAVTWPGLVGVLSGMNAHGVAGATMMIHQGRPLQPGLPYLLMYREALAGARKMTDVHDYVASVARTCPNNFMVVDETGAAEVIEFDSEVLARRGPDETGICSTNHFLTKELQGEAWRLGLRRYRSLQEFLRQKRGRIDLDGVREALVDVAPWLVNVQSMVFLPRKRSLYLSVGGKLPAAKQPFVYLDRELLFGK
jgi:hypothetical protein